MNLYYELYLQNTYLPIKKKRVETKGLVLMDEQIRKFQELFHYQPKKAQDYIREIQLQGREVKPQKHQP